MKYKRKANARGRGRKNSSAVVIRDIEELHEVQIVQGSDLEKVKSIIEEDSRSWDLSSIQHLVPDCELEAISHIPLPRKIGDDKPIWPNDKCEDYSVKTGYRTIREGKRILPRNSASSSHLMDKQVWRIIWQMKAPPRVKQFMWRATQKALATNEALLEKRVKKDPLCPICNEFPEMVELMLLTCDWVQGIWFACLDYRIKCEGITTLDDWLVAIKKNSRGEPGDFLMTMVGFICWTIWKLRCEQVFQRIKVNPIKTIFQIKAAMIEYGSS
ncbi:hypothetical protein COLO4_27235 [Corchorus olitorius]|uniref:Reverse transcriptase zinc-binding domain-containing protein n=1 Tax=Corchorus olitorius TaxID=93759 RepID=A0A1R3HS57_9ROSI|nr:hypothetical protein COLO4_27235 [Corchorus olitorius]